MLSFLYNFAIILLSFLDIIFHTFRFLLKKLYTQLFPEISRTARLVFSWIRDKVPLTEYLSNLGDEIDGVALECIIADHLLGRFFEHAVGRRLKSQGNSSLAVRRVQLWPS
jgi:hypothetical protein